MLDIFLGIVFCSVLPFIFVMPSLGVLAWYIVAYAAPHHLTPGFAYNFPVSEIIGLATLAGWLLSREPKRFTIVPTMMLLLVFTVWISFTTLLAISPDFEKWRETVVKIAAAFLAFQIMRSPQRIHWLAWVSAMSVAFYGIKGGIFAIATLGAAQISGPPASTLSDNNDVAVAFVMVLPLLSYARAATQSAVLKVGYAASIALTSLSVLVTYSRGGLLAIGATGIYFWLKSRHKLIIALLFALAVGGAMSLMPEKWFARMESIGQYGTDASVQGRFNAWNHAFNIVKARPLIGGGFGTFTAPVYAEYSPGVKSLAGHSIYFECLGEQGIVGLGLFLAIWLSAFRDARRTIRLAREREDLKNMGELARMLQISLIGYAIGGAFLSLTYFELFYGLVVLCAATRFVVEDKLSQPSEAVGPQPTGSVRTSSPKYGRAIGWVPRPALRRPQNAIGIGRKGITS
jgi:putative inorganic carbon (HCO3(-)) transporter